MAILEFSMNSYLNNKSWEIYQPFDHDWKKYRDIPRPRQAENEEQMPFEDYYHLGIK